MIRVVIADSDTNAICGDLRIEAYPIDSMTLVDGMANIIATYIASSEEAADFVSFADFTMYLLALTSLETRMHA